jgi:hypothetical protein
MRFQHDTTLFPVLRLITLDSASSYELCALFAFTKICILINCQKFGQDLTQFSILLFGFNHFLLSRIRQIRIFYIRLHPVYAKISFSKSEFVKSYESYC